MTNRTLISTHISRASALALAFGGLTFLFASDAILPRMIPGFPASAAWIGQILAASWLAIATLNWLTRSLLLGGIYGRHVVLPNAALYFVSAMSLLKVAIGPDPCPAVPVLAVLAAIFAVVYAWLLYRGPFERDMTIQRARQSGG